MYRLKGLFCAGSFVYWWRQLYPYASVAVVVHHPVKMTAEQAHTGCGICCAAEQLRKLLLVSTLYIAFIGPFVS